MRTPRLELVRRGVLLFTLGAGCAAQTSGAGSGKASEARLGPKHAERVPRAVTEPAPGPAGATAIVGATLLLGNGRRIESGTVVFEGGRISLIGPSASTSIPEGARRIDAAGKFVSPGLIDTHSHMGVYAAPHVDPHADGNEMTDPLTPWAFSEDGVWTQDPAFFRALAGGVTTVQILPGSGNLIGGKAVTLKLRPSLEARAMRFPGAPFGLKMACGENPKRYYGEKGRTPMSRMGNLALQRKAFLEAEAFAYQRKAAKAEREAWTQKPEGKEPAGPDRDLGLETLAGVLAGEILVHIHCYRADEMLLMLALAEEMGFQVRSFHHAVEAYKIADVLSKHGVAASMWADWWGFKLEAYDGIEENIPMLARAGGRAIVHSDSNIGIQRLNQEAAKALYAGRRAGLELGEDEALRWITENPAWALGVLEHTGTLEAGKMADLVLWDQHPLSIYAKAELTFVDGVPVYDRGAPGPGSDFELGTAIEGVSP